MVEICEYAPFVVALISHNIPASTHEHLSSRLSSDIGLRVSDEWETNSYDYIFI